MKPSRRCRIAFIFALLAALGAAAGTVRVAAQEISTEAPIALFSQTVPLDPRNPRAAKIGELDYRGGIALRSTDPRFGGFSALHVSTDGATLLAISDRGHWLRLRARYDRAGRLVGAEQAEMGPLIDEAGKPFPDRQGDAEALAVMPDGSMIVAFERTHKLLHYPEAEPPFSKPPAVFPAPDGIERAPPNGGIEAMTHVGRGFLVAIAERLTAGGGALAAWVGRNGQWEPFAYVREPGFRPTALGLLPGGDLMAIEHRYTAATGSAVRFVRIPRNAVAPYRRVEGKAIAVLEPPLTTDNVEGLAIRRGTGRETLLYVLTDDNFNPLQRTLLMVFALTEAEAKP